MFSTFCVLLIERPGFKVGDALERHVDQARQRVLRRLGEFWPWLGPRLTDALWPVLLSARGRSMAPVPGTANNAKQESHATTVRSSTKKQLKTDLNP